MMTVRRVSLARLLGACDTVAGIGQDLQAAGRAITGSSKRVQQGNASPARARPRPNP